MIAQLKETMAYVLGIDIGTSFTAAAVSEAGDAKDPRPQVLTLGSRNAAVPTVLFFAEDGHVLVGEAAERRGLDRPDLVVREFKRRVGDTVPIIVGELALAPEALYARMVRWVVDRAEEREGTPAEAVILTCPASWGDYKTKLVGDALTEVGLSGATLLSEPEAAALQYASQERLDPGSVIAVYDFGGGTFDVAIVRKQSAHNFQVLGRPEGIDRLGGADFDQAVFEHVVASIGDPVRNLDVTDPDVLAALARVRRECVEAKEALSYDSEASIPVLLPGTQANVRLVRSEFETMIGASVGETIVALRHALDSAGCTVDDLSAILLVGGSSRVPLIAQLLSGELDRPIAIDADPKASICLGAAFAAAAAYNDRQPTPVPLESPAAHEAAPADGPLLSVPRRRDLRPVARVTAVAAVVASLMVVTGTASHFAGVSLLSADASAGTQQLQQATDAPVESLATESSGAAAEPAGTSVAPKKAEPAPGAGDGADEPVPSPGPELYEAPGEEDAPQAPLSVENVSDDSPQGGSSTESPPPDSTSHPSTPPTSTPTTPTSTPHPTTPAPTGQPSGTPAPPTPPATPTPTPTPTPDPPATDAPPTTSPPVTEPPATDPPVTEPPVTEPPATDPPSTEPPPAESPEAPAGDATPDPAGVDAPAEEVPTQPVEG
jgi:actin-like ATPase involved in cell morphogenesis